MKKRALSSSPSPVPTGVTSPVHDYVLAREAVRRGECLPEVDCMLDSGAFSAWRLGTPIDLQAYMRFLATDGMFFGSYVGLDHIMPGDPEEAAKRTLENTRIMRKAGLDPIHVFHVGEHLDWLKKALDDGVQNIGLAALSLRERRQVRHWYDIVWRELTTATGEPTVRVHGFGETSPNALMAYPWHTADSTSWFIQAANGSIILPNGHMLAARKDGNSMGNMTSVEHLSPEDRKLLDVELDELGCSYADLVSHEDHRSTMLRMFINAVYYLRLEEQTKARKPCPIAGGLFNLTWARDIQEARPAIKIHGTKLYLGVGTNDNTYVPLFMAGGRRALVSFHGLYNSARMVECVQSFVSDPEDTCRHHPSIDIFRRRMSIVKKFAHFAQ